MKDTMIRFRDGSIGMNNTCSRLTPTSATLVLLICFPTTLISSKKHIGIKSSRLKDWRKVQQTNCRLMIVAPPLQKGRKRNPEGTTETQPREFLDSKKEKRADSKHVEVRGEQQRGKE